MAQITLRVLDGADRGQVYDSITTPVTIGREEGNTVQLNDERISRFHIKIQEDHDKVVLTDLESTNGTRVNGEETQLRILRYGDVINVGRSVLLYGTREQIASRLDRLKDFPSEPRAATVPQSISSCSGTIPNTCGARSTCRRRPNCRKASARAKRRNSRRFSNTSTFAVASSSAL
jgi:pSer/pThr/pTyr-binding forkhead associated (FHA) protein